jgi:hypothetical protein
MKDTMFRIASVVAVIFAILVAGGASLTGF